MKNENVYCYLCNKKLAWWDMFTNLQFEEEWECNKDFWKKCENVWGSKDGKSLFYGNRDEKDRIKYPIEVKRKKVPCSVYRKTQYCRSCAYKLQFRCVAPRCKGKIVKVRNKN